MDIRRIFTSSSKESKSSGIPIAGRTETAVRSNEAIVQNKDTISPTLATLQRSSFIVADSSERPSDLGVDMPMQLKLHPSAYPKSKFGKTECRFNPDWFNKCEWLEYSQTRDAAFCFPCNKFSHLGCIATHQAESETVFSHKGYRNWKYGLEKHEQSKAHRTAMVLWKDLKERQQKGKEVSSMVNEEQCERNRYYVQSTMDIIFFLTVNELPLRGSVESTFLEKLNTIIDDPAGADEPCGLFMKMFQYTLQKDPRLSSVYSTIPRNASYTSPEFQNEVIHHLANLISESVVSELGDNWFTLMCDGTRDVNGLENISIVLRYVDVTATIRERLLCIVDTTELDAEGLTNVIMLHLEKHNIRLDRLLAQCYDGSSVISGTKRGIQALVQER